MASYERAKVPRALALLPSFNHALTPALDEQVPVDSVTEDDVIEGRGKQLDVLYVTLRGVGDFKSVRSVERGLVRLKLTVGRQSACLNERRPESRTSTQ